MEVVWLEKVLVRVSAAVGVSDNTLNREIKRGDELLKLKLQKRLSRRDEFYRGGGGGKL